MRVLISNQRIQIVEDDSPWRVPHCITESGQKTMSPGPDPGHFQALKLSSLYAQLYIASPILTRLRPLALPSLTNILGWELSAGHSCQRWLKLPSCFWERRAGIFGELHPRL